MTQDETATPKTRIDLATKPNFSRNEVQQVKIVNVDIPFLDLPTLLIKLAMAAIPAAIVVGILGSLIGGFLVGLLNNI